MLNLFLCHKFFVSSVSSGAFFSSVHPPLLALEQFVHFSEDHLDVAGGARLG